MSRRRVRCRQCGTVFSVGEEAGSVTCLGCGREHKLSPTEPAEPPRGAGAGPAAPQVDATSSVPPAAAEPPRRGEGPRAFPTDLFAIAAGAAMLLLAAGVAVATLRRARDGRTEPVEDAAGPPDPARHSALERRKRDLQAEVEDLAAGIRACNDECRSLEAKIAAEDAGLAGQAARQTELAERIAEARRRLGKRIERIGEQAEAAERERKGFRAELGATGHGSQADVIARSEKATLVVTTDVGSGSGFIVEGRGTAVTSYHVVAGSSKVWLQIQERGSREKIKIEDVEIVAVDADRDLALLRLGAAPKVVGEDGTFPVLPLRSTPAVRTGESVFALGSPGEAGRILDYTVTEGIVSNPERRKGEVSLVQTSAPVNPGNSGGPLLDRRGRAIGVIALKGVNVEGVAFAVPASAVVDLLRRKGEQPYAVGGSFQEWERENRPLVALGRRQEDYDETRASELGAEVDEMALSPDGKTIYLLLGELGRLQEFLVDERKPGRTFMADTVLTDMDAPPGEGRCIYLAAKEQKAILRVDTTTMTLLDKARLASPPRSVTAVPGPGGAWAVVIHDFRESRTPTLLARSDFGRDEPAGVEMSTYEFAAFCGCSRKWLCLVRMGAGDEPYKVIVSPVWSHMRRLASLERLRKTAADRGYPPSLVAKIGSAKKQIARVTMTHAISGSIIEAEGPVASSVLFNGPSTFTFGRRIFEVGKRLRLVGEFAGNPILGKGNEEAEKHREFYRYTDNLFSVSRDGRWAASGTHIYAASCGPRRGTDRDVESARPLRRLPFPTLVSVFSSDGKSIYLADPLKDSLYMLTDWKENAAPVASP